MQLTAAARTHLALRLDHHLLMWQVIELLVAAGAALPRSGGLARRISLLGFRPGFWSGRLQLLERQRQLVVRNAFGLAAELCALELGDDVLEFRIEAFQKRIALNELLTLGTLGQYQRAQSADVVRQSVGNRYHGASKYRFPGAFQRRLCTRVVVSQGCRGGAPPGHRTPRGRAGQPGACEIYSGHCAALG